MATRARKTDSPVQRETETTSLNGKVNWEIRKVKLADLSTDLQYQREHRVAWVKYLAEHWNDNLAGLILVSHRSNGQEVILDGQHRVLAQIERGSDQCIAQVFSGLTLKQEAEIWLGGNNYLHTHALDRFRAETASGDEIATAIVSIAQTRGFKVGHDTHRRTWAPSKVQSIAAGQKMEKIFTCPQALKQIYKMGVLEDTLTLLAQAWPDDPLSTYKEAVVGVSAFLFGVQQIKFPVNYERLDSRLSQFPLGPILQQAEYRRNISGERRAWVHVAIIIKEIYNAKLRKENEIPEIPIPQFHRDANKA